MKTVIPLIVLLAVSCIWAEGQAAQGTPKIPYRLSIRFVGGASYSRIVADSQMANFFAPTSKILTVKAVSIGPQVELGFGRNFAAEVGFRYAKKGQNTAKTTVTYTDDPFPHEFESQAELSYLEVPLVFKPGLFLEPWWISARLGISPALLLGQNVNWIIDGRPANPGSDRMPAVTINDNDCAVLLGGEAGVRFRSIGVFLMGEYQRGFVNIANNLTGSADNKSVVVALGVSKRF